MRTGWVRLFLVTAIVAGTAVAQEGPERGGMALGSGQMIRGTVTAVAADHLSMKTDSGEAYEIAVSPNTRVMKDRQPLKIADVKAGDSIGAMGELDAPKKTVHALFLIVVDPEQVKKLREGLGKEYISGKVTAIDEVKLTIQRPDHVSQVIEVDETTSFRRTSRRGGAAFAMGDGSPVAVDTGASGSANAGESITLADVKVGDVVAGRGGIKHGVFVPTTLTILPPGGPRGRRGGEAGAGTTPPAAAQGAQTPKQ